MRTRASRFLRLHTAGGNLCSRPACRYSAHGLSSVFSTQKRTFCAACSGSISIRLRKKRNFRFLGLATPSAICVRTAPGWTATALTPACSFKCSANRAVANLLSAYAFQRREERNISGHSSGSFSTGNTLPTSLEGGIGIGTTEHKYADPTRTESSRANAWPMHASQQTCA